MLGNNCMFVVLLIFSSTAAQWCNTLNGQNSEYFYITEIGFIESRIFTRNRPLLIALFLYSPSYLHREPCNHLLWGARQLTHRALRFVSWISMHSNCSCSQKQPIRVHAHSVHTLSRPSAHAYARRHACARAHTHTHTHTFLTCIYLITVKISHHAI